MSSWRITLTCGDVYRVDSVPDLARPLICGVAGPLGHGPLGHVPQLHGMRMIRLAERLDLGTPAAAAPAPPDLSGLAAMVAAMVAAGRDNS